MKRFVITAAVVAALGFATTSTAHAQYVQQYSTITPNGGVVIGNNYSTWGAQQFNRTYVSPFGGVNQQTYYNDVYGNSYGRASGYSPYGSYNRGFYQPSPFVAPYGGGYNYNFYRRY